MLLEEARGGSSPAPDDAVSADASSAPLVKTVDADESRAQDVPALDSDQAQGQTPLTNVAEQTSAVAVPVEVSPVEASVDKKDTEELVETKLDEVVEDSPMEHVKELAAEVIAPAPDEENSLKRPLEEQIDDSEGSSRRAALSDLLVRLTPLYPPESRLLSLFRKATEGLI